MWLGSWVGTETFRKWVLIRTALAMSIGRLGRCARGQFLGRFSGTTRMSRSVPICRLGVPDVNQPALVGEYGDLYPVAQVKLGEQPGYVGLDRGLTEIELSPDF
jgi:hypothetical protein